ncbi:MAG: extracellular solute-binding protein [Candidatus Pacebacteria bacterium]|nr:extracellular solute-binding protein [Candidatus Paceibacterota bacterium]
MLNFNHKNLGFLALVVAGLVGMSGQPLSAAEQKVVNVYSWADYIDPMVIKNFEKDTGIKVVFDTYDSDNTVEAKLSTGASGYDVVNTDELTSQRLARIGQLVELDRSKIPNWKDIDPAILKIMQQNDPGNRYNAPLYYGSFGIMYNVDKVKAVDPNVNFDSFATLLDPKVSSKFAKCGIALYDGFMEHYGMYFITKGKSGNIKTAEQVKEAEAVFMKIRPSVRKIEGTDYVTAMANGEICVTTAFSGDFIQATEKAASSGVKVNLNYVQPKEGGMSWTVSWIIPKTSVNQAEAYAFINYMLEAKNAAANTNHIKYPNVVLTSRPFVKKELLDNPAVYMPVEQLARMEPYLEMPPGIAKLMTKSWNRFKSGR